MSVVVSCNLPEGVVLGVDSALTVCSQSGRRDVVKIYENAEKLFALRKLPVGIAAYGAAAIGARSIGSYLQEFESIYATPTWKKNADMANLVEALREFMYEQYRSSAPVPARRAARKSEAAATPSLGLVVTGFSVGLHMPEVWHILVPDHSRAGRACRLRPPGDFGANWFASAAPIRRYIKGCDIDLLFELTCYMERLVGRSLTKRERKKLDDIAGRYEYQIPFAGMPLIDGIALVNFLIELVISHYRFAAVDKVVAGRVQIGMATYRSRRFEMLGQ